MSSGLSCTAGRRVPSAVATERYEFQVPPARVLRVRYTRRTAAAACCGVVAGASGGSAAGVVVPAHAVVPAAASAPAAVTVPRLRAVRRFRRARTDIPPGAVGCGTTLPHA